MMILCVRLYLYMFIRPLLCVPVLVGSVAVACWGTQILSLRSVHNYDDIVCVTVLSITTVIIMCLDHTNCAACMVFTDSPPISSHRLWLDHRCAGKRRFAMSLYYYYVVPLC